MLLLPLYHSTTCRAPTQPSKPGSNVPFSGKPPPTGCDPFPGPRRGILTVNPTLSPPPKLQSPSWTRLSRQLSFLTTARRISTSPPRPHVPVFKQLRKLHKIILLTTHCRGAVTGLSPPGELSGRAGGPDTSWGSHLLSPSRLPCPGSAPGPPGSPPEADLRAVVWRHLLGRCRQCRSAGRREPGRTAGGSGFRGEVARPGQNPTAPQWSVDAFELPGLS